MKIFFTYILSLPNVVFIIFLLGMIFYSKKKIIKIYKLSLFLFFLTSLPISSFILTIPISKYPNDHTQTNLESLDGIIVLTGGIKKNIIGNLEPSQNTVERILVAKQISKDYSLPLIISGGKTLEGADSEALISQNYFDLENSILDENSRNTYESAINLKTFCKNKSFLLVTSLNHSLRSYLTFKSHGCNVKVFKDKKTFSYKLFIPSAKGFFDFNALTYEFSALLYYVMSNKIKIINI